MMRTSSVSFTTAAKSNPDNKNPMEASASSSASAANHHDDDNNSTNDLDPIQTCLVIQEEFHNLGKALLCPLCLSTLRTPTLLPCNHAFCRSCITTNFDPKHNRTISPSSGKHTFKNQCPICKVKCTKRGMQESEHLAELVRGYKEALRSFGFTPIVYDEKVNIAMTQIEDSMDFDVDAYAGFSSSSHKNPQTKSKNDSTRSLNLAPDLRQVHEHYEVSSGIAGILKKAVDKSNKKSMAHGLDSGYANRNGNDNSDESNDDAPVGKPVPQLSLKPRRMDVQEMERQNQVRKLNYLLKDQEKVVQVDERALVRAAVSKQKRNSRSGSLESKSMGDGATGDGNVHVNANVNKRQEVDQNKDVNMNPKNQSVDQERRDGEDSNQHQEKEDASMIDAEEEEDDDDDDDDDEETIIENTQHRVDRAMSAIATSDQVLADFPQSQSQVFFSAPDSLTAPPAIVPASAVAPSPQTNEAPATTQDRMDDAREIEAADRSGEWLEHEVEIEEQKKNGASYNKENTMSRVEKGSCEDNLKVAARETSQIILSDNFFSAASEQERSQELLLPTKKTKKIKDHLPKGIIVKVEDRTWPGVNKPGGVARIVKVHTHFDAGVKYDVAYIIGGREKMVDSAFVREHQDSKGSFTSSATSNAKRALSDMSEEGSVSSAPARKSRRVDERKQVEEWIAQIDAEEESKSKVEPATETYARGSTRRSARVKAEDTDMQKPSRNKTDSRKTKKNPKIAPKQNDRQKSDELKPFSNKMRKARTPPQPEPNEASSSHSSPEPKEVDVLLNSMTFREIIDSASSHYSTIPSKTKSKGKKDTKHKTIFVTCSNLSEHDQSIVQKMILEVPNNDVKVKLLKDFNPYRTSILVTSTLRQSKNDEKIAKLRTMKAMRSTLAHIPIVDVSWCESCLLSKQIIGPTSDHCITSLPTRSSFFMENLNLGTGIDKKRDFSTAVYGVPSLVASRPSLLFQNVSVFICGTEWKKSATKLKDVQLLLREGGGVVLTSASQAVKVVNEELELASNKKVVLLCDDSSTDSMSGISAPLAKAIRGLYDRSSKQDTPVLTVNSKWLFDSISCAKILECDRFQPCSPVAISLWRLCSCGVEVEQI